MAFKYNLTYTHITTHFFSFYTLLKISTSFTSIICLKFYKGEVSQSFVVKGSTESSKNMPDDGYVETKTLS